MCVCVRYTHGLVPSYNRAQPHNQNPHALYISTAPDTHGCSTINTHINNTPPPSPKLIITPPPPPPRSQPPPKKQTLLTHELLDPDRVAEESNRHTFLHIGAMRDDLPLVELLIGYNVRMCVCRACCLEGD